MPTLEEIKARLEGALPQAVTLDSLKARLAPPEISPPIPRRRPEVPGITGQAPYTPEQPPQVFPGAVLAPEYFQPLTQIEEQGFLRDYADYAGRSGLNPNPDDPRHAYNYRAWWRAMQQDPQRFGPQVDPEDRKLHGPSLFKAADHPNRFVNVEGREVDTITGQPRQQPQAAAPQEPYTAEPPGLGRSALHAVVQGAAGGVAGFPEAVGIGRQDAARGLLAQYNKIDRSGLPDPQYRMPAGPAMFYVTSDAETRQRLRDEAMTAIRPVAEEPAYQIGQRIRESTAGAFPIGPEQEGRFPVQLGRGLGSTATFLGTGFAGKLLRLPALPVIAGTGVIANSSETFRDAIDKGASFEDAYRASRMAGVVGTSEAFPLVRLLGRLDDASGGQIRRLIIRAAKGGVEEGSQELFQNVFENLIASKLVPYDPERGLFMGSGEAAGVGASVGSLLNVLASMLGVKMRHSPQQTTEQTVRQYTEHTMREPGGVPVVPGVPAERGAPFTRPGAPVVPALPTAAPTAPPEARPEAVSQVEPPRVEVKPTVPETPEAATSLAPAAERIHPSTPAAVKVEGKIFVGASHGEATALAAEELGKPIGDVFKARDFDGDGFLTTRGRYVSREEAVEIAASADQVLYPTQRLLAEELKDEPAVLAPPVAPEEAQEPVQAPPEGAEREDVTEPTTEQTEQGPQTVIPGADRISDRALAERKMEQPLQPGARQKPADEGLFDVAGRGQMELPEGPYSGLTPTLPRFAQATGIERPKGRYAGSINLDRLNTPEEIKRAIGFVSKQQGEFKEARRGRISWQETEALAADLGLTVQKLRARRRGEAFNAEQIEAARTLHLASAENLHLLAKKATDSGAYEDVLAFDKAYYQHVAIQAEIEGSATEAGRALNIHRKLAAAARGEKAEYIKEIIQSTGGRASMEELMGHIASLDAEGVGRYVQKAKKSTRMEKLREAWYMALLSDPTTQGVNIGSNAIVSLWTVPEHAVSGVIGKLHGGEKVYLREVFGRAYGVLEGAKTGLRMAYNAFESEVPSDLLSKVETQRMKAIPSVRLRKGKEKKRVGRLRIPLTGEVEIGGKQIRIPGRALLAGDEFFKGIGYSQKLHELAIRDGIQKGKRGPDLLAHVREIKRDVPEGMHSQARRGARLQTFTEPGRQAGRAAMYLREKVGTIGWIVAPFMRTPINIFKFSMKRTPIPLLFPKGEVWEQIRAGGAERDIALGRIAFGSALMVLVESYATAGLITGAGPDDPREKALLRSTGWQPYSFKVGDEYLSYFYYEPLGSLIGLAADAAEIRAAYPEIAREEEWDRLAAMMVGSMTNNLTNKTYTRGLSEAIRAIDDPSTAGERWMRSLSGTLIPTGIASTARRGDPVLRDARSILDNFKSRIPGLRETLPPRLDPFGQTISNEGALGPDIVSRVYRSTGRPDKVVDEMLRLKVTPGRPGRVIKGVRLSPEQYIEFVQLWRQAAKKELDILVNLPGWDQMPDYEKRESIRNAFRKWRDHKKFGAVITMFTRHPELVGTQIKQEVEALTQ